MATAALPPWDTQRPPPLPVRRFTVAEYRRLAESGILTEDDAVELLEGWISEPEPDVAVVRGSARSRASRHPRADEVVLVIEVADTSLDRDRGAKARIYARAGIPVYWIVNLVDRQLEVYAEPIGETEAEYRRRSVYLPGNGAILRVDDRAVAIDPADLLP